MIRDLGFVYKIQVFLAVVVGTILAVIAPHQVLPFVVGVAIITLNFYLLTSMWKRVFDKKPVATTLLLIITKYTVLGVLLFVFVRNWSSHLAPFLAGVTSIVGSFLILAFKTLLSEKNK